MELPDTLPDLILSHFDYYKYNFFFHKEVIQVS